jgi:hypothetical protein
MQIQTQLSDASPSTNILKKPEHILMFVKHALEDTRVSIKPHTSDRGPKRKGLGLGDLKIVQDPGDEDELGSGDSDDEDEAFGNTVPDEITVTTLNLLLALLEGDFLAPSLVNRTHWKPQQTLNYLAGQTLCWVTSSFYSNLSQNIPQRLYVPSLEKPGWCSLPVLLLLFLPPRFR